MMIQTIRRTSVVLTVALLAVLVIDHARAENWDDFSSSVRSAKRRHDSAVERAANSRDKAVARADATCEQGTTTASKALVAAIKSEANRETDAEIKEILRDVSVTVENALLPETKTPKQMLEGKWVNANWQWTFESNGTVTSRQRNAADAHDKGLWKISDDRVYIVWEKLMFSGDNYWSTLRMPLDEHKTIVDDWSGIAAFTICKEEFEKGGEESGKDDAATGPDPSQLDDISWDVLPAGVTKAKADYDTRMEEVTTTHAEAITAAKETYQKAHQAAYDSAAATLDTAIETAKRSGENSLAGSLENAKKELADELAGKKKPIDYKAMVIGTWVETKETPRGDGYRGRWMFVFTPDGKVTCSIEEVRHNLTGKWTLTDTHVIVSGFRSYRYAGGSSAWIALRLPLDEEGTVADSWSGLDAYTFKKVKVDD